MLLMISFIVFGACVVSSSPVERRYSTQEPRDLDFQDHLEFQDDSLALKERGSQGCKYDGETYEKGTLLNITSKGICHLHQCKRRKFRKVNEKILQYCDEPCELGWLPGCCLCKRKSCENNRKPGDTWMQVKKLTGPNEGICSRCRCGPDNKEYCWDNEFSCSIPGCQETEKEPMPDSCCPKCKIWKKPKTTTQPWTTIPITLTTEGTTEPYPFTFPPGFDSSEDENR